MNQKDLLDNINSLSLKNMGAHLGIEFTAALEGELKASMPVDERTKQPYGVLHGGASAVLAETIGSVGSHMMVSEEGKRAFGIEINTQHLRPVLEGSVHGTAKIIHKGRTMHTWHIDIHDDKGKLISISKLIVAIR